MMFSVGWQAVHRTTSVWPCNFWTISLVCKFQMQTWNKQSSVIKRVHFSPHLNALFKQRAAAHNYLKYLKIVKGCPTTEPLVSQALVDLKVPVSLILSLRLRPFIIMPKRFLQVRPKPSRTSKLCKQPLSCHASHTWPHQFLFDQKKTLTLLAWNLSKMTSQWQNAVTLKDSCGDRFVTSVTSS